MFTTCGSKIILGAVLLFACSYALAQRTTGEILGTVTDETGGIIPGVGITVRNLDTGLSRTVTTGDFGNYHVRLLPIGRYVVIGELPGFKRQEVTGIILQVDQVARIDLTMVVGEITDVVEVLGEAPLTQTDSAGVGMVIGSKATFICRMLPDPFRRFSC